MIEIKVEGNKIIKNNKPAGGDILICEEGYAWLCDEHSTLTRIKDGKTIEVEHMKYYEILGKAKNILLEEVEDD